MDLLIIGTVVGILGYGALRARGRTAWVAGAALFLFIWAMIFAILGRNDFVSAIFVVSAVLLVTRQYRRRDMSSRDLPAH